jgi:hypothetical protein
MTTPSHDDPPEMIAAFIEETLNDLAGLAERKGYRNLAATLLTAAGEAARAVAEGPDRLH